MQDNVDLAIADHLRRHQLQLQLARIWDVPSRVDNNKENCLTCRMLCVCLNVNVNLFNFFFQAPFRPIHLSSIRNGMLLLHKSANLCVPAFEGIASSLVMSKILGLSIT